VTIALGVDGGGRKTYAIVVDALGTLLGAAAAGPSNWELVGVDGARDTIAGAADHALAEAGVERSALDASELAVRAVADQYTGRGPSTILADMPCEHLGAESVPAMIERLCREDRGSVHLRCRSSRRSC
jgi:N-acetylglucosamine kinase-like BadF-type ATPase